MSKGIVLLNVFEAPPVSHTASVAESVGHYDAATSISNACKNEKGRYNNLVKNAQLAGSVTSLLSISKPIGKFVPVIDIPTNFFVGVLSFLKVIVDVAEDKEFSNEDAKTLISSIGNFSSVGMSVSLLTGNVPGLIVFSGLALVSSAYNIISEPVGEGIIDCVKPIHDRYFSSSVSSSYPSSVVSPDFSLADQVEIERNFDGRIGAIGINGASVQRSSISMPDNWFSFGGTSYAGDEICKVNDEDEKKEEEEEEVAPYPPRDPYQELQDYQDWWWREGRWGAREPEGIVTVGNPISFPVGSEPDCTQDNLDNYAKGFC